MSKVKLETISETLNEIRESGKAFWNENEMDQRVEEVKSEAERIIRKHPLASVAAGLFVGFLIGRLFSSD